MLMEVRSFFGSVFVFVDSDFAVFFAFVAFLFLRFVFWRLLLFCFCCFCCFFVFVAFLLWQLFSFLFLLVFFHLFALQRRNQTRKQASKHELLTFGSGVLLGGGAAPPPNPPRATKSALHLRHPRLPRNQYFKVNSPATNQIRLLC